MSFADRIRELYQRRGPRHILPFIGASYSDPSSRAFRVAVVGLNAYSEPSWAPSDDTLRAWWTGWWEAAGHGDSQRFFEIAYREADKLARIVGVSDIFSGLTYDAAPQTKSGFYGTNAVKVFLGEEGKTTHDMSAADFEEYSDDWHQELDLMADHGVLPHLVVVLGEQIWDLMWRSFYPEGAESVSHKHFAVTEYECCDESAECFHYANRVTVAVKKTTHTLLLVRMSHPAAFQDRRAYWLLGQPEFRRLAGLPS
jgi:hypothetical protein